MTGSRTASIGVLYAGWTGRGELGDDAVAEALVPRLTGVAPWHLPRDPAGFVRRAARERLFGSTNRAVLLGGGTVLGQRNWRLLLTATGVLLARHRPWYLIGAGVDDPDFPERRQDRDELARWVGLCRRFDRITVRGPRSASLLAAVGVAAEVVGDPALLHHNNQPIEARQRLLGVNLGFGGRPRGTAPDRVVEAVAELLRELVADGWLARLLIVDPMDKPLAAACLRRAGVSGDHVTISATPTVDSYLAATGECTVLLAQRLPALVLGSVAATPLVGLVHEASAADFLESVHSHQWSVRVNQVDATVLRSRIEELARRRDDESRRLAGVVARLRALLERELSRIRDDLGTN
jgi:polysaccharide pyruvyl transferase WcaK-like protein